MNIVTRWPPPPLIPNVGQWPPINWPVCPLPLEPYNCPWYWQRRRRRRDIDPKIGTWLIYSGDQFMTPSDSLAAHLSLVRTWRILIGGESYNAPEVIEEVSALLWVWPFELKKMCWHLGARERERESVLYLRPLVAGRRVRPLVLLVGWQVWYKSNCFVDLKF